MEVQAAVVHEEGGSFEIEAVDLEEPQSDEVLVRVVGPGVRNGGFRDEFDPL